jgi:hypothetical protein
VLNLGLPRPDAEEVDAERKRRVKLGPIEIWTERRTVRRDEGFLGMPRSTSASTWSASGSRRSPD